MYIDIIYSGRQSYPDKEWPGKHGNSSKRYRYYCSRWSNERILGLSLASMFFPLFYTIYEPLICQHYLVISGRLNSFRRIFETIHPTNEYIVRCLVHLRRRRAGVARPSEPDCLGLLYTENPRLLVALPGTVIDWSEVQPGTTP